LFLQIGVKALNGPREISDSSTATPQNHSVRQSSGKAKLLQRTQAFSQDPLQNVHICLNVNTAI
jgi:hypothetical protein